MNQQMTAEAGPDRTSRYLPGAADSEEAAGFRISISDLRGMFWRQRKIVAIIVALALVLGALVTLLMTPRYEARTTVRIDNESAKIVEGQDVDPVIAMSDTGRYLMTQKRVVESRSLATDVANAMNLAKDNAFIERMGGKPIDSSVPANQQASARLNRVVDMLLANVSMEVRNDTRIATITFTSKDPELAAQVANSYGENYVAQNIRARFESNAYARRVLNQQVEEARVRLQETERRAIDYARQFRLIDTADASTGAADSTGGGNSSGTARSIVTANLSEINSRYMEARAARVLAQQRWNAASGANVIDLPEARTSATIQTLIEQRAVASARLGQLRQRYRQDQPEMRELAAQVSALTAEINAAGQGLKNSIRKDYEVALRNEEQLAVLKDQLANETLTEQDRRVQLNLIARDAETQRSQLNGLLTRLNQVNSAADIISNNISVLDPAQVPGTPVSPDARRNLLIALSVGLALAVFVAFAREALDDTLRGPDDVENKLHLPLLGTTPLVTGRAEDELTERNGQLSEAYYSIRATVDYASAGAGTQVYLVTSSQPSEGKSTTSIALARDFARIGRRVLLIDADLRNPSLHRTLAIPREHGLVDVLMGHLKFEDAVAPNVADNLDALVVGRIPPNPAQLLSSGLIDEFTAAMRQRYDVIILDSAPVMGLADAPMLSRSADHVLVIVEANRAHYGQAKSAIRRLQDAGANIMGIIMTKFSYRDAGYSYNYHYGYYDYRAKDGQAPTGG